MDQSSNFLAKLMSPGLLVQLTICTEPKRLKEEYDQLMVKLDKFEQEYNLKLDSSVEIAQKIEYVLIGLNEIKEASGDR